MMKRERNLVASNFRLVHPSVPAIHRATHSQAASWPFLPRVCLGFFSSLFLLLKPHLPLSFFSPTFVCIFPTLILTCRSPTEDSFVYPCFLKSCVIELSLGKYVFYRTQWSHWGQAPFQGSFSSFLDQ